MGHRIARFLFLILCLIQLPLVFAAGDPNDIEGSKDPDLFSRMPGFHINRYDANEFDRHEFQVGPGKTEKVEGYHTFVVYYANEGITLPSGLQSPEIMSMPPKPSVERWSMNLKTGEQSIPLSGSSRRIRKSGLKCPGPTTGCTMSMWLKNS